MFSLARTPQQDRAIAMPADRDEILFFEGDPCSHVYELREGIVRGVSLQEDGERQVTAFFFPGDQIGIPLTDDYRFTAEAVTPVRYVRHSRSNWHEAFIRSCREEGRLLPSICAEQDPIFRRGIIIGRNGMLVRLSAFLISIIDRLAETSGVLHFPLTQGDIAAYLATAPESVCRAFGQLREMGVIARPRRDRLVIKDRDWLHAIAAGTQV